ncbi:MAG: hypothetical protein WDM96_17350 [Lacunisphaera sp.]
MVPRRFAPPFPRRAFGTGRHAPATGYAKRRKEQDGRAALAIFHWQVFGQESLHPAVKIQPGGFVAEAMSFVVVDDDLVGLAVFLQFRLEHFPLADIHAGVVVAVGVEQRHADVLDEIHRGAVVQVGAVVAQPLGGEKLLVGLRTRF